MGNGDSLQDDRYAPPQAPVADVEAPAQGAVLATRWQRFGAALVDGALSFATLWVVGKLTPWNPWDVPQDTGMWTPSPIATVLGSLLMFFVVQGWLLVTRGQTVGKIAVGIRITRPDGQRASIVRILGLRYSLGYLTTIVPVLGQAYNLVDCLMIFRSNKRCLHDVIADTVVVKA